ncbi:MAG: SPOR domain-containing protein [Magnetococcus sp. WYHC-3]
MNRLFGKAWPNLPWIAAGAFGLLALSHMAFMMYGSSGTTDDGLWIGPLMPGKVLPLTPRPDSLVLQAAAPDATDAKAVPSAPAAPPPAVAPAENPVVPAVVAKAAPPPPVVAPKPPAASPPPAPAAPAPPPAAVPPVAAEGSGAYWVQLGSFVRPFGAETLAQKLRNLGFDPVLETAEEAVKLNEVQAGPYNSLEEAKEAEIKLKAGGLDANAAETWQGQFVVRIGQYMMLAAGAEEMERAEALGVRELRMVKVDSSRRMTKVMVGPFERKEAAREAAARLDETGQVTPVIVRAP